MDKKLYLSTTNKQIAGVCGGLAEYFGIDATLIRVIFFCAVCFGGFGGLLYLLLWIFLPKKNG